MYTKTDFHFDSGTRNEIKGLIKKPDLISELEEIVSHAKELHEHGWPRITEIRAALDQILADPDRIGERIAEIDDDTHAKITRELPEGKSAEDLFEVDGPTEWLIDAVRRAREKSEGVQSSHRPKDEAQPHITHELVCFCRRIGIKVTKYREGPLVRLLEILFIATGIHVSDPMNALRGANLDDHE